VASIISGFRVPAGVDVGFTAPLAAAATFGACSGIAAGSSLRMRSLSQKTNRCRIAEQPPRPTLDDDLSRGIEIAEIIEQRLGFGSQSLALAARTYLTIRKVAAIVRKSCCRRHPVRAASIS